MGWGAGELFRGSEADKAGPSAFAVTPLLVRSIQGMATIASQLESLKTAFFDACADLLDSAVISRTLTVGQ